MLIYRSSRDAKLKGIASLSCALLGLLMLARALIQGNVDYFGVINISTFLALGAAFAVSSAWLDKLPTIALSSDSMVIQRGLFRTRLLKKDIEDVSHTEKSIQITTKLNQAIRINSLSLPPRQCVEIIKKWRNESST